MTRSNLNKANSNFSKIKATSEKLFGFFNKSTARLIHRVRLARYPFRLGAILESSLLRNVFSNDFDYLNIFDYCHWDIRSVNQFQTVK